MVGMVVVPHIKESSMINMMEGGKQDFLKLMGPSLVLRLPLVWCVHLRGGGEGRGQSHFQGKQIALLAPHPPYLLVT